jgi:integrase
MNVRTETATATRAGSTPPPRRRNADVRPREYLTPAEVDRLIAAAEARGRYGQRDATAVLLAFSHGLRAAELVSLTWVQVDFNDGVLHVKRAKGGRPSTQPLRGPEIRALRQLHRDWPEGRFVFQTERGGPMTTAGLRKMIARVGEAAGFDWGVHPHQLRHACGYALANKGTDTRTLQHYLGHRSIENTVRYPELAADRFNGLWQD